MNSRKQIFRVMVSSALTFTFLLTSVLLSSCSLGKPEVFKDDTTLNAEETGLNVGKTHTYTQDFSSEIKEDDKIWYKNEICKISKGVVTSDPGTHFMVSCKKRIEADICNTEVDIQSSIGDTSTWVTAFVGLRVNNYTDNAVANTGIWLAFKNNTIGFLSGTWPNVNYVDFKYDFRNFRRVYIEDNIKENKILIYVKNDKGKKELAAQLEIKNNKEITLYNANKSYSTSDTLGYDVAKAGYIVFWSHLNGGVSMANLKIKYKDVVARKYVGFDKLKYADVYSDTWVATDALGRTTPTYKEASAPRDKKVGIFYFPWHALTKVFYSDQLIYDHTKTYNEGGHEAIWDVLTKGPISWPHYWAQPYFGYYLSNDEWVIRKHANMLVEAGVDFIFYDLTNGDPFTGSYMTLLKVYKEMREEGLATPEVTFLLGVNPDLNVKVLDDLQLNLYKNSNYNDLLFKYDGKPLLMGDLSKIDKKLLKNFSVRQCWALKDWVGNGKDKWTWMQEYPQVPGSNSKTGKVEQLSVSCGFLVNTSQGRSYRNGKEPNLGIAADGKKDEFHFELKDTKYGYAFEEQMKRAYEVDPDILMVTGWNEWTAGRWEGDKALIANTYFADIKDPIKKSVYIDAFNAEFSRDIEPMKGEMGDAYYYQLSQYIRKFKGVRPVPAASGNKDIKMNTDFTQWYDIWPEYKDTSYDTEHRDTKGFASLVEYKNKSGRNDFKTIKVSAGSKDYYFYAQTRKDITKPDGKTNWMNLYIDADQNAATGWSGYDFVINRDSGNAASGTTSIHKCVGNAWKWEKAGEAEIVMKGDSMVIKVSKSILNIKNDTFDFKWADNSTETGEAMEFMDLGDAAPNDRYNYRYTTDNVQIPLSDALKTQLSKDTIAVVNNKNIVYNVDKKEKIDSSNTNAKVISKDGRAFIPSGLLNKRLGFTVDTDSDKKVTLKNDKTSIVFDVGNTKIKVGSKAVIIPAAAFVKDGVIYLPLDVIAEYADLTVSKNELGVTFISSGTKKVKDTSLFNEVWANS